MRASAPHSSPPPREAWAEAFGAASSDATWIFDLDNTLYPAECNLFAQVDHRMGEFIARYARRARSTTRGTCRRATTASSAPRSRA